MWVFQYLMLMPTTTRAFEYKPSANVEVGGKLASSMESDVIAQVECGLCQTEE